MLNNIKTFAAVATMMIAVATTSAQASVIDYTIDTTADFASVTGPSVFARGSGFLAPGATARLNLQGAIDPDAVVDGELTLNLGFNEANTHTGDQHIGQFDLVHAGQSVRLSTFDAAQGFRTSLFNGSALAGDWFIRFVSGTGPDPWTSFAGGGTIGFSVAGTGGGEVPAPGPLGLIAAMGFFGIWRRRQGDKA